MKTTQHTPGKWFIHETEKHFEIVVVDSKTDEPNGLIALIPKIAWCNESEKANAKFIATACNAFHSLKQALVDIALLCENETDKTDWQEILRIANKGLASSNERE